MDELSFDGWPSWAALLQPPEPTFTFNPPLPRPVPDPVPTVNPTLPVEFEISLPGQWQIQTKAQGATAEVLTIFHPNGLYNQFTRFPKTPKLVGKFIQVWGTYALLPKSTSEATLSLKPTGWEPNQLCDWSGNCQPISPKASETPLQALDADSYRSADGTARRVQ
jgi:hypothetical protein